MEAMSDVVNSPSGTAYGKRITDPKFAGLLTSFKDGIREGIRRYHVFKPATAAAK